MTPPQAGDIHILVVDDDHSIRLLYKRTLSSETSINHFNVTICGQAEEAVDVVRKAVAGKNPFSVVFLDVKMPHMSGIELKHRLEKKDPSMKFILVTGHGSDEDYEVGSHEA